MGAPVKRKREQQQEASTSTQVASKPLENISWHSLLANIQGQKGEPGAIEALNQLSRVINTQRTSSTSKKSENEPSYRVWSDFLTHWQRDPGLKDVVSTWERGEATSNNALTISSLHVFTNLLNVACSPSAGLIALDSPYQPTLASLIQEVIPQLHYLQKYLNLPGKNDLATASLELIGALLKLVRHGSARNATNRKIWDALNLDARAICRLLSTKRKIALVNKYGRKPDIRHLMFNVLNNLLGPSSSLAMKIDVLSQKGVISSIFKGLSEDPAEFIEAVLDTMARLVALPRLPLETRCRVAEDSWMEVLKLYARTDQERTAQSDPETPVYPPAVTVHRYLLFVVSSLASVSSTPTPAQRKALGGLIGLLELSDSLEQAEIAAHTLSSAPELLPSFWTKFAPSLEPRLSSKWVTSVAFATRVVASPLPDFLVSKLRQAEAKGSESRAVPNLATLLDTALMPPAIGKTWISKALQQSDTQPLVSYLTCQFLMAGMQKCVAILERMQSISAALRKRGDTAGSLAWKNASSRLSTEAADRLPDLQVLIALVQKTLGRAFSRASSVVSVGTTSGGMEVDGESAEDDNSLMTSLALRTIYLYRKLAPSVFSKLRFDFGKLLTSPFFASASESVAPLATVGQSALLKIISLPADAETGEGAISWAWSKSSDGGLSPIASIIWIYLSSPLESLRSAAEEAATSLLSTSLLFEHDPSEIPIWLEALPRQESAQLNVMVFFDGCLQRCLQTPYKYVDQMSKIVSSNDPACKNDTCRQASPLLATLLEQSLYRLSKEESAKPYVLFMQHLLIGLACHSRCRCILTSVLRKLSTSMEEISDQKDAKAAFAILDGLASVLLGQKSTSTPAQEEAPPLERMLQLASAKKEGELNSEFVHAFKTASSIRKQQLARLSGYLLLNGHRLNDSIIDLVEAKNRDMNILHSLLEPILDLPEMPAFFEHAAHMPSPALDVLCHLVNQVGRYRDTPPAFLQPYAEVLASAANPETVIRCASVVRAFITDQLLVLLRRLLDAPRTKAEEECMILLCETLASRAYDSAIFQSITIFAEQLYERKQDWCDSLIASWAECFLPFGFLASPGVVYQEAAMDDMSTASPVLMGLARQIAEQGIRSEGSARVLAVAIYRSSSVWKAYSASTPILSSHPDSTRAVLAYLEVAYNSLEVKPSSTTLKAMTESAGAVLAGESSEDLQKNARQILLLVVKVGKTMASGVLSKIQTVLGQDAIQRPQLFNEANAAFLATLHGTIASFESFATLETFFNTALPWLVRRFAEDVQNDETVAAFITEFANCLVKYPKKWLLKPHLVEPVVTAAIQNRLEDPASIAFAGCLVAECKLQDQVYVKQVQSLLADRRLRSALQPASQAREALVQLVQAFDTRSPGLMAQLNAIPILLPFYQATMTKADKGLLQIFRRAEFREIVQLRQLVQNWVPWQLRGVCTGPFQVLANLNPQLLYRSQCYVLQHERESSIGQDASETADPTFYLALISSLLEEDTVTRSNWLALVSSNALGLAICSLASSTKAYVIAADRILARARNALQSAEMREKDEILYLLDCVRNAIEPSASTSAPGLPPLIALCIADALHGMSAPEGFLYPAAWRWLLSRPLVDTTEVPLFYSIFYGTSDDRVVEMKWLLRTLQNGVHTSADWRLLRRRQVVELLLDYLQSGAVDGISSLGLDVLKTVAHLTKLAQPVHDLMTMTRSGFLSSLAIQQYQDAEERSLGIAIIRNCITMAQPTKLRRARDGLWLADLVRALNQAIAPGIADGDIVAVSDILRRTTAHLVSGSQESIDITKSSLTNVLKHVVQIVCSRSNNLNSEAAASLYDAAMRLVRHIDGSLFDSVTCLALQAGIRGVKQELISSWQQL